MSDKARELPSIFAAALAVEDGQERSALIDRLTGSDEALRRQVHDLIDAHHSAKSFLAKSPGDVVSERVKSQEQREGTASVMSSLQSRYSIASVALCDGESEVSDPVIRPNSTEIPTRKPNDRYQLQGEIARGGMGAILKGRDVELGRSLAIKVLLEEHKDDPQVIQRFIEEAQIGGQLQHPGIAPVYEFGQFEDQRPFFTMKLVKGKTLAAMLLERTNVFDRAKLLGIYEQICQTMAYAHSRGVVHRDLKPANIMVGAFGEVQVMDWGLAKVLRSGGTADEKKARQVRASHSVIQTYRNEGSRPALVGTDPANAGETLAGSVMGTPDYMSPEQARGEVDRLDERCDVFGLGAILCEILTGRPPYFDDNPREVIRLAQSGNLDSAFKDMDACRADQDLVEIAKACLAFEPTQRIRDAKVLAERITAYLEGVETKLHETELARAAEESRAVEARKRQRVTVALAASVLLTFVVGTAAWMWNQNQLSQRKVAATHRVNESLAQAKLQSALAHATDLRGRVLELEKAIGNASTACELAEDKVVDASLREAAGELLASLKHDLQVADRQIELADADHRLREKLENIRLQHADGRTLVDTRRSGENFDNARTRRNYRLAFAESGHDLANKTDAQLVAWIGDSEIRETLISAMDHWSSCMPPLQSNDSVFPWQKATSWEEAALIAKGIRDKDPSNSMNWMRFGALLTLAEDEAAYQQFCQSMLDEFGGRSRPFDQERLVTMCVLRPDLVDLDQLPTQWMDSLNRNLSSSRMVIWYPWAWNARAMLAYRQGEYESARHCITRSRDFSPSETCEVLNDCILILIESRSGDRQVARAMLEKARENLRHTFEGANGLRHDLVIAMEWIREAERFSDGSVGTERLATDLVPTRAADAGEKSIRSLFQRESIRHRLYTIANEVDTNETRRRIRRSMRDNDGDSLRQLASDFHVESQTPELISSLAAALWSANELDLATSTLRRGQRSYPSDFWLSFELGRCLCQVGSHEEGLGFSRAALAIRPTSVGAMWAVTAALMDAERNDEALEQFKSLLASSDLSAFGYRGLAAAMRRYGHPQAAYLANKRALELAPNDPAFSIALASSLAGLDRADEAIVLLKKVVERNPQNMFARESHTNLLWIEGKHDEAIKFVRESIDLFPKQATFHHMLGLYLGQISEFNEAIDSLERAAGLSPSSTRIRGDLATAYSRIGMFDEAGEQRRLSREAYVRQEAAIRASLREDPRSATAHYKLGYALYQQGKFSEAADSYQRSIDIDDGIPTRHYKYGFALWRLDRKEDALEQWKRARELNPDLAKYHERVGWALKQMRRPDEAIPYYQEAVKLNPDFVHAKRQLAQLWEDSGSPEKAIELSRRILADNPQDTKTRAELATHLFRCGELAECEEVLRAGLSLGPADTMGLTYFLGQVQAARGNVAEAIATFENTIAKNDHPFLRNGFAQVLATSAGDLARAKEEYRKALESEILPQASIARLELSRLLADMGRLAEAKDLFAIGEGQDKLSSRLHCQSLYVQFLAGEKNVALETIKEFVETSPDQPAGYMTWAEMLLYEADPTGRYAEAKKAVELATQACNIMPYNARAHTLRGISHFRAEQHALAIVSLRRAVQLGDHHPRVWLYLSLAHQSARNSVKAKEYLNKAETWMSQSTGEIPYIEALFREAKAALTAR